MEKQGRIYYVDRELNETEVVRDFEFPCMFFVKKGNEIVKQITYDLHGVKSVATMSDEKKVLGDQITCSVVFNVNALGDKNKVHSTLGIVYSQKVKKNWNIPAKNFTAADDTALFVYAKCSKTTEFGSIEYTAQKKVLDEDDAFYFLLGTLHAPVGGLRIMSLSAGTATVDGGLIKLGIISSLDGQTTFNLNTGEITGKITFLPGSPAQNYIDTQVGSANQAAAAANQAAQNAQSSANAANTAVGNLSAYVDGAFSDGLISEAEAVAIEKYINTINSEKSAFDKLFTTLYANGFLTGTPKTNLNSSKTAYNTATTNLINSINTAIADEKITAAEKADVDAKFTAYNTAAGALQQRIEEANAAIQTAINTNASNAQAAANNAQATANNAISQITDIGSDNKLSPSEKQQTLLEWNRIQSEYAQYYAVATTLQLNVTAYTNAYNALNTYITPLLANLSVTSDIVGNTFRTNFNNYYTQHVQVVTAIENKKIENVQVGGRNLLRNSDFTKDISGWLPNGTGEMIEWSAAEKALDIKNGGNNGAFYQGVTTLAGDHVVSFDVKPYYQSGTPPYRVRVHFGGTSQDVTIHTSNEYHRYSLLFANAASSTTIIFQPIGADQRLYFKRIKLEKGNKATDWTPAPEDIDAAIGAVATQSATALAQAQNAQNTAAALQGKTSFLTTDIHGNVVATGTVAVGDVLGGNAGITGVTDRGGKSVRFWAGSDYAGKNTADWLMRDDGVEEQWFNGVLVRQRGVINGVYVELWFNLNGQLGKKITFSQDGKILEEWYNNGVLVYQIGQNGIYYVAEIPESFTPVIYLNLNSNASSPDINSFRQAIKIRIWQKTSEPTYFELRGGQGFYLYNAGQNVYSEYNKQFEGVKNSQSINDNIIDGWYVQQVNPLRFDGLKPTELQVTASRFQAGKVTQSVSINIPTTGQSFNQF